MAKKKRPGETAGETVLKTCYEADITTMDLDKAHEYVKRVGSIERAETILATFKGLQLPREL